MAEILYSVEEAEALDDIQSQLRLENLPGFAGMPEYLSDEEWEWVKDYVDRNLRAVLDLQPAMDALVSLARARGHIEVEAESRFRLAFVPPLVNFGFGSNDDDRKFLELARKVHRAGCEVPLASALYGVVISAFSLMAKGGWTSLGNVTPLMDNLGHTYGQFCVMVEMDDGVTVKGNDDG